MPRTTKTTSTSTNGADAPTVNEAGAVDVPADPVAATPVAAAEPVAASDPAAATHPVAADNDAAVATKPTPAARPASKPTGSGKAAGKSAARPPTRSADDPFLLAQREALLSERGNYVTQAEELKAQADSLALEHEPGDVQFDEEGGEGGTSNVDRELDLLLSAQARGAVEEIDRALTKIDAGTYGRCEQCGQEIPEARLEALPHASLCVVCKAGGLSSRR